MVGGSVILLAIVLAACGSSNVVPTSNASAAVAVASPSAGADSSPSAGPSALPSPTATDTASPTATPSPTPSPTAVPALALSHCSGKAGTASSSRFNNTQKYFAGLLDATTSKTVTCVEASWVQPAITCAAGDTKSDVVIFVGIGGTDGKGTTGSHERPEETASEGFCDNGIPTYIAWTYSVQKTNGFKQAPFFVSAHDVMWGEVRASGHSFKMTIADLTTHQTVTVAATVKDAIREDAQWSVEAPEYGCPKKCVAGPLAKFAPIVFTGADAVINGTLQTVDRWPRQTTTMATGSLKRVTISGVAKGTFTATWHHK